MTRNLGHYCERPNEQPRAIIYTPAADDIEAADRCLDHCRRSRYSFVGVVKGNFVVAQRMVFRDDDADILVVDRSGHLPADLLPRIEVVAEVARHREHRRTRIIRPGAEA